MNMRLATGWAALWVLCVAVRATQSQVDTGLVCYDGPFENALMEGCVDDCAAFETLPEAEAHCNLIGDCNGIVKTTYGDEGAIKLGVGLYEVRKGPGIKEQHGEMMWVKQEVCGKSVLDEGTSNTQSAAPQEEPLYHRENDADLKDARKYGGGGDDWEDDWDEGLDGVAEAYRKVFLNMIIVISFLGMVSTLLFISYKMGHDMTIELIDRTFGWMSALRSRARDATPDMAVRSTYDSL